jgi:hypothetical protein
VPRGLEFVDLAEGTTEGAELIGYGVFHFPVLPVLGLKESVKVGGSVRICQMAHFLYAR